jgi:hypothetical protein
MKGIVTMELNERQQNPGVNSPISRFYSTNQVVEISEALIGDTYDGNNVWYRLKDGAFVWSGAVELMSECERMKELDRFQFLVSYRQRDPDGRIRLDTKEPAKELYFAPLALPASADTIKVNELIPGTFAPTIVQSVLKLNDPKRKHVFVYIHGYQAFASLKLNLFTHFVENYMTQPENKIAKALFMVWPAQGLSRKKADDRALAAGRAFTANKLFAGFAELSRQLNDNGMHLNLIVHSFGHQLLNGMVNPGDGIPTPQIFENIFLMAPDVTHLAVQQGGVKLRNYFPDNDDEEHYEYAALRKLGKNINVFYDHLDLLLYASTKKFVAKRDRDDPGIIDSYLNLGNYGADKIIPPNVVEKGFNFFSVRDLVKDSESGELLNYPYRDMPDHTQDIVRRVRDLADYGAVKDLDIFFHLQRYPSYHRYLFTCKPVVAKVNALLA